MEAAPWALLGPIRLLAGMAEPKPACPAACSRY